MKKSGLLVILACAVFLIWTMSCQSPSSTDNPSSSSRVEDSQSNSSNESGSSDSGAGTNMGFLRLLLTDAPIEAKNVYVTISKIRVHETCEDGEDCFHEVWENSEGKEIDLLALEKIPFPFPEATIPAGTYNQIRMAIKDGQIVFGPPGEADPSGPHKDDKSFPLVVPSDEIKTNFHFVLESGQTIQIMLDLDAKNSIHIIKKKNQDIYKLRPVIHVVEAEPVAPGT